MSARTPAVIRIATYNVHKCRGMDRRVSVSRVAEVIARLDADVIAIQEIVRGDEAEAKGADQARFLARELGYGFVFGQTRRHLGVPFGNATFSRLPFAFYENYDITWRHRERRGCLRTDVRMPTRQAVHIYNVHLGTSPFERPHQARRLLSRELLNAPSARGPRVVMGDFNDWTRSVAATLMGSDFESVDVRLLGRRRTYPGLFPVLHLDHFYYDRKLRLRAFTLDRSRLALLASDHLPLVAEFEV
jgi:endonuclease/exonuclease/phosphatase family metal-dependent hydrolase